MRSRKDGIRGDRLLSPKHLQNPVSESLLSSVSYYAAVGLLLLVFAPIALLALGWAAVVNAYFLGVAFLLQLSAPLVLARLIYHWTLPNDSVDYSRSALFAVFDEWLGVGGFLFLLAVTIGATGWQFYEFVRIEGIPTTTPFEVVLERGVISGWLFVLAIVVYVWDAVTHER